MKNQIKINADNIDVSQIMKRIHENLKQRGYDIEEIKKLSKGINNSINISKTLELRLKKYVTKVENTNTVQYWWEMPASKSLFGKIKIFIKKVVRKFSFFYMKHVFDQQNIFNSNVTESIDKLSEYCIKLSVDNKALEAKNQELEEKIISLTSRLDEIKGSNSDEKLFESYYRKFENKFRGSFEEIKNRQQKYVKYFEGCKNVIDIGCGRGEFLSLLKENNINASGIELTFQRENECIKKGFRVYEGNGMDYLNGLLDESVDGIFCAQVIEHITTRQLLNLITIAYKKLKRNGTLILETLNPECLMIFAESFYLDPTHRKPVHPKTLSFFVKEAGFSDVKTQYFTPSSEKLQLNVNNSSTEKLNNLIFGNREYAVIARK